MAAYLVYICQSVSDRKELETYWKDMPRALSWGSISSSTPRTGHSSSSRVKDRSEGRGRGVPFDGRGQEVVRQPGIRRGAPAL